MNRLRRKRGRGRERVVPRLLCVSLSTKPSRFPYPIFNYTPSPKSALPRAPYHSSSPPRRAKTKIAVKTKISSACPKTT